LYKIILDKKNKQMKKKFEIIIHSCVMFAKNLYFQIFGSVE